MSVKGLEGFIEKNLLHEAEIEADLKKVNLLLDASHYLTALYKRDSIRKSLSSALGGYPAAFKIELEKDLQKFKELGITVSFIFDGFDLWHFNSREEKRIKPDPLVGQRKAGWDAWTRLAEKGRLSEDAGEREALSKDVLEAFEAATSPARNITRHFIEILIANNTQFMVAPVSAKAEISYLISNGEYNGWDCAYGDSDLLLFESDRVIFSLDFDTGKFTWTSKDDLKEYKHGFPSNLNFDEAFMDACILAGGVYDSPTFPTLVGSYQSMGAIFTFERATDLLRTYHSGIKVIRELLGDNPEYTDRFARTKGILTFMPIMKETGRVETLAKKSVPNDIAVVVTPRFSNEIYLYTSRRVVGTEMYDLLVSDSVKIPTPLDGGESQEYRNLLNQMVPIRTTCLALLSSHSNRFFHHKHLTITYFYQPDQPVDLPAYHVFNIAESPYGRTRTWHVPSKTINSITKVPLIVDLLIQTNDVRSYVLTLRDTNNARRTIVSKNDERPLLTLEEIIANSWWRHLQLRDFIKQETHTLTPWGEALADGLERLHDHKDLFDSLYLTLELFRLGALHHDDFSVRYPGGALYGSDEDKRHTRFISRLACTANLTETPYPWNGPLSKAFLAFNSMVMEVSRNLRNLFEMVVLSMLVQGDANRDRPTKEWTKLGTSLPLDKELDTTLAIFTRCKIERMMRSKRNENYSIQGDLYLLDVDDPDSLVADAKLEIERVFRLWDAVLSIFNLANI